MNHQRPPIEITLEQWKIVQAILERNVPEHAVWAFGSRVTGRSRKYSDLDLAIMSQEPLGIRKLASLAEDFSESDLPWKVDVIDWATTSASFRTMIDTQKVLLQEARS